MTTRSPNFLAFAIHSSLPPGAEGSRGNHPISPTFGARAAESTTRIGPWPGKSLSAYGRLG